MPNGQSASQVAEETQKRLGQKIYTTPPNTKDPFIGGDSGPADKTGNGNGNGNQGQIDPQRDPLSFAFQNREALSRMPEDKAIRFTDMLFRRYALPKYMKMNPQELNEDKLEELRIQFAARMFDLPYQPVEIEGEKGKSSAIRKAAGAASAAGAGV